jgi:glyoxylase I family protein
MQADSTSIRPMRLHHAARIVRDHEANRKLVEDVLGIPLVATWCESVPHPEKPGVEFNFCHTFYEISDGSALAFFQFERETDYANYMPKLGSLTGMFDHTALKVEATAYDDLMRRLKAADCPDLESFFELDHGYCRSLYVKSRQGFMLEFTCDPPQVDTINAAQMKSAHASLQRWLSGDHSTNNDIRHD